MAIEQSQSKTNGRVQLRSRNNKDFGRRYPTVAAALSDLPDETVIDGEIVAPDESGRPSFNALQNYGTSKVPIFYYVFDVPVLSGHHLRSEPLAKRRDLLRRHVLPKVKDPNRQCTELNASLSEVIRAVQAQGLEGVVAKDLKSAYESGRRSGVWCKMRLNKGQEFVIGGYTLGAKHFDAVIFGYYEKGQLLYAGRTRNGVTPMSREQLLQQLREIMTRFCGNEKAAQH